jgi:hypothetical protein
MKESIKQNIAIAAMPADQEVSLTFTHGKGYS